MHGCFCSDVQAVRAADLGPQGKLVLLSLGCVEEPYCCWADWGKWARSRVGTGPHYANHVRGCVQMGSLSWELGWVKGLARALSPWWCCCGYFRLHCPGKHVLDCGQHLVSSILLPCPPSPRGWGDLPGPFLDTTKKVFYSSCLSNISLQYFVPIEQCCSLGD